MLVPEGQLLLLEHVLSGNVILRPLMQLANPLMVRMSGANMNRETVKNVERAGFAIQRVDDLWGDIVKCIEAEKPLLKAEDACAVRPSLASLSTILPLAEAALSGH